MKIIIILIAAVLAVILGLNVYLLANFYQGMRRAEKEWQQFIPQKMTGLGNIKSLEFLPLIDWFADRDDLKREPGGSYLIKTEKNSILFDVGLNGRQKDPSPLLHNMKQLGVSLNDFDTIVISHNHLDHVGGMRWQRERSFSLTSRQIDLGEKVVYTPVPMTYPNLTSVYVKEPVIIAEGVASIGTIPNQLFLGGWTPEQALAVNVEGKGIILIIGCGHQTLPKIFKRTETLFDEPIYGIIGGLHYPVTDSRIKIFGIKAQRYVGTDRPPWRPINMSDVRKNIEELKKRNPKIVRLSAHDSCDVSIAEFRRAFSDAFDEIRVGKKIII
ncbi:MAG: MBL fold metallo-hydrolase [Deltaproteobacteria bacterium]|nr:MAG: MBL fold metallo-hydrolase [Deltaproteobacteria bacterium]